jgi:photosystem II stability/assembly factor-like uncharacterized protein
VPPPRRYCWSGIFALGATLSFAFAEAPPQSTEQSALEHSEMAPLAPKSMLLDAAYAGTRIVLVGERGHVLLSDDQGASWRQAVTPTLSMLTAVYFVDTSHGWAVGHDEVILRSDDGGEHWTRVHYRPEAEQPLLDVYFRDADHGIAVGAYSAYYTSADGGRTWQSQLFSPVLEPTPSNRKAPGAAADDEGEQYHLNAIAAGSNGRIYIGAESGHLYRSDDGGATWLALKSPYEGSFFGVLALDGNVVLAFGMRGHLFRSENAGADWSAVATSVVAILTSGVRLPNAGIAVTALAGVLLISGDGGRTFHVEQQADRKGMSSALLVGERLLTVGDGGVIFRPLAP